MTRTYVLGRLEEPVLGTFGVGDGLLSGEGLGGDNEEGRLGLALLEHLSHVCAVHVADEVALKISLGIVFESFGDHNRAKVRTTDANVDHALDGFAGVTLPAAAANSVGELLNVVKHALHLVNARLIDLEGLGCNGVSQGDVQHGSVFRGIDMLTTEHGIARAFNVGLACEAEEGGEHLRRHQVLGVIQEKFTAVLALEAGGVLRESLGILGEELRESGSLGSREACIIETLQLVPGGIVCICFS